MCRWSLPIALLVGALAAPAVAQAVPKDRPWATINVCDTERARNVVGVRAGMPGNGTRQRMRMRFELQWLSRTGDGERRWARAGKPSEWVAAGSARFRQAQRGWSFVGIADPPAGERFRLRGLVRYQWRAVRSAEGSARKRVVVVRRATRITRGGLRGVVGGRPPGTSRAVCVIDGPAPGTDASAAGAG